MFHCVSDGLHCCTCNRVCYKWVRKQVSPHLKKHYLNTIKILSCWVFFPGENKQYSFWLGLQMLLLHCHHFSLQYLCAEHSACSGEESLPWGAQSPNRWEKKPKGMRRKAQGWALGCPRSRRTSLPIVGPLWAVAELSIYVVDRHKQSSAQKSCAGLELSWGCRDPRVTAPARDWKGCVKTV